MNKHKIIDILFESKKDFEQLSREGLFGKTNNLTYDSYTKVRDAFQNLERVIELSFGENQEKMRKLLGLLREALAILEQNYPVEDKKE